jgi:hypothetical protein
MLKRTLVTLLKLLVAGAAFSAGLILGGMLTTLLRLPVPEMPAGVDGETAALYMFLLSPLPAAALALLSGALAGGVWARAGILALFLAITYTINTAIESLIFMTTGSTASALFNVLTALPADLLCALAVAWLFKPPAGTPSFGAAARASFRRRSAGQWAWRLALAVVAFAPVYWLFGSLVYPVTREYYEQEMFGLRTTTGWGQLLPVLLLRSALFLAACLPAIVAWQRTPRSLWWRLGSALFITVGLVYMLAAYWMPAIVRIPHGAEIAADSFVHAALLVLLLGGGHASARPAAPQPEERATPGGTNQLYV